MRRADRRRKINRRSDAWERDHSKSFAFRLWTKGDADVIAKLESVPNKTDYVRRLIRADMKKAEE